MYRVAGGEVLKGEREKGAHYVGQGISSTLLRVELRWSSGVFVAFSRELWASAKIFS